MPASQAGCRGFESHRPLLIKMNTVSFRLVIIIGLSITWLMAGCVSHPQLPPDESAQLSKNLSFLVQDIRPKTTTPDILKAETDFIWPLKGSIIKKSQVNDMGIAIKAFEGQEIRAVKSGTVAFISPSYEGYGKTIIIRHTDNFISFYAHNSDILVKLNESVKQGQVISRAGHTGRITQPQLGFWLFKNENPVDPLNYLP
jgi:murein DD-endopeptidase MepM/ murein hydrolase activator NlpD